MLIKNEWCWKCCVCGKSADYVDNGKQYCEKHWDEIINKGGMND